MPSAFADGLSAGDMLAGLLIAVLIVISIILYHILFIVVDARRIVRRVERLTGEVETIVQKPLAVTDKLLTWAMHSIEYFTEEHGKHKKK